MDYMIDKIDYVIDTRGYKNFIFFFNFSQKYNKIYNEDLTFYNLKTKRMKEIDIYSVFLELRKIWLNYKDDDIYQLKSNKTLKTLATKFTWNMLNFNYIGYYRDMNLIFVEQIKVWYYQNTSYFITYKIY